MTVCISPNGSTTTRSDAPARQLNIGTVDGVRHVERSTPTADWEVAWTSLQGKRIGALLYEPSSNLLLAGTYGDGLFASADGGHSWERKRAGLSHDMIFSLAARSTADGEVALFAGTEPVALYRSDDRGDSWMELPAVLQVPGTDQWDFPAPPHFAHLKGVTFHPSDPQTLYAVVEQGALLVTSDDGQSWSEIDSYATAEDEFRHDVHRVAIRPSDPDQMVLTTGCGAYVTRDAGQSWEHVLEPDGLVGYPDALLLEGDDDRVVYIVGAQHPPFRWPEGEDASANPRVLRSDDFGTTWEDLTPGLPQQPVLGNLEAASIHSWPGHAAVYAASTSGTVFASEDRGLTWSVAIEGLPPISKSRHYRKFLPPNDRALLEAQIAAEAEVAIAHRMEQKRGARNGLITHQGGQR